MNGGKEEKDEESWWYKRKHDDVYRAENYIKKIFFFSSSEVCVSAEVEKDGKSRSNMMQEDSPNARLAASLKMSESTREIWNFFHYWSTLIIFIVATYQLINECEMIQNE